MLQLYHPEVAAVSVGAFASVVPFHTTLFTLLWHESVDVFVKRTKMQQHKSHENIRVTHRPDVS